MVLKDLLRSSSHQKKSMLKKSQSARDGKPSTTKEKAKGKRKPKQKPAWNDTIHDLSKYKLSESKLIQKRLMRRSTNMSRSSPESTSVDTSKCERESQSNSARNGLQKPWSMMPELYGYGSDEDDEGSDSSNATSTASINLSVAVPSLDGAPTNMAEAKEFGRWLQESSLGSIGEVSGITESSEMDTTYEKEDDTSCEAPTRPQFREQTENTVQEAYPEMQSASESSEEFHASLLLQQHVQQQVASMKNPETSNPSIPTPFLEAMTQLSEYLREIVRKSKVEETFRLSMVQSLTQCSQHMREMAIQIEILQEENEHLKARMKESEEVGPTLEVRLDERFEKLENDIKELKLAALFEEKKRLEALDPLPKAPQMILGRTFNHTTPSVSSALTDHNYHLKPITRPSSQGTAVNIGRQPAQPEANNAFFSGGSARTENIIEPPDLGLSEVEISYGGLLGGGSAAQPVNPQQLEPTLYLPTVSQQQPRGQMTQLWPPPPQIGRETVSKEADSGRSTPVYASKHTGFTYTANPNMSEVESRLPPKRSFIPANRKTVYQQPKRAWTHSPASATPDITSLDSSLQSPSDNNFSESSASTLQSTPGRFTPEAGLSPVLTASPPTTVKSENDERSRYIAEYTKPYMAAHVAAAQMKTAEKELGIDMVSKPPVAVIREKPGSTRRALFHDP